MTKSYSESYKDAGVDITAGYKAVELMKEHVARTMIFGKTDSLGGFGGLFQLELGSIKEPVLVSGTDGVGTKLKMAFLTDKHDTVGIDCVAMCVNDIICVGAKPLFFLDYIAVGKNIPEKVSRIVSGVAEGCVQSQCALIGGETAEMPGFYGEQEYDMAGFAVGIVDKSEIINKANVMPGDVILGLASSGIHSNGFSLVRKVLDVENIDLSEPISKLKDKTLGEVLMEPTRIYVKPVLKLLENVNVKSIANITGGGFYENIPRALPENMTAKIKKSAIPVLPIFKYIQEKGSISERDMYNTFNMGIGMVITISKEDEEKAKNILQASGEEVYTLGEVIRSDDGVVLW
ncbi:MAG: phosphoribosylformylglycinamidine cyclo-ligase [Clostridiales bacterium]|nr:phosphoribosylformylglycinamidine cyclo-ligase [Clostridiales bacterium]MDD7347455.1 phosphoribosylformylglycinamidine cyclo-ligase [Clostridiales bacterium]MDY4060665.1 phosphoribosylformylglycinamidine cyclo-ligase [Anaerovoracaceae bacterium]